MNPDLDNDKRLQRVVPMILLHINKIYKKKGRKVMTDNQEEQATALLVSLLRSGKGCDAAIRRIAEEIHTETRSVTPEDESQSLAETEYFDEESVLQPSPPASVRHGSLPHHVRRKRVLAKDWWAKVAEIDYLDYEDDKQRRLNEKLEKMQRQRDALDQQLEYQHHQKQLEREEAVREHEELTKKLEIWEDEKRCAAKKVREACEVEKKIRDTQLQVQKEKREQELKAKRDEEERLYNCAIEEEKREQEKMAERKEKVLEGVKRNMYYNVKQQALKDEALLNEQLLDKKLAKQHAEKLQKQEELRQKALLEISSRQAKQREMGEAMCHSLMEKAAADEKRALEACKKALHEAKGEEERRRVAADVNKRKTIRFLQRQLEHKQDVKEREMECDRRDKERTKKDILNASQQEKEQTRVKKHKDMANHAEVVKQIKAKQDRVEESMTRNEKALNSRLLDRIITRLPQVTPPPFTPCGYPQRDTTPILPPSLPSSRCGSVMI